eukprot:GFUD01038064.1.p1 GENE.GFUD01038064.1~~GFUD01038064.1.p1  ORF type:complete len:538 (+),score=118.53 GFUD01038064.1:88-1701(+)
MSTTMRWDKDSTVQNFLVEDFEIGQWTDIVLVGEDGARIKVHKMVLAASSKLLENLLKEAEDEEETLILLPNIPGWVIKLLVKMVYGSFALDSWALGNELIVEAAEVLGLVPEKFAHLNVGNFASVMNISDLTDTFSDKEIIREVEHISNDIFKEIDFNEEIPMDIMEFIEDSIKDEGSKSNVSVIKPFVRKTVIQQVTSVRRPTEKENNCCNKENKEGSNELKHKVHLENEKKILECEKFSVPRRKLLLSLLTCPRCNQVFQTAEEKESHVQCQGETLLFSCIFKCKQIFSSFSLLCQHVSKEHRFNVKNMVKKLNQDPVKKPDNIQCRICQTGHVNALALQNHFKAKHENEAPYVCDLCGHKTHEEVRFKRHMVCHMPERPKEYCNICFKEFRNKVSLRTHRNMVHKLGRKYTCAFCGKVLYSSQYLKKHEATHTGDLFKGVVCKFCGKTVEYTKLKNHELTHTGEKPFKCSDCDYRCIQRSNLRIHMRGIHKKDLPRLAVGQKRYSGVFMDGTAGNNDPFDLRSVFHQKIEAAK